MSRIERTADKYQRNKNQARIANRDALDDAPNWEVECETCGQKPTVGSTGLCGPCCFGEADTAGGNW